MKNFYFFTLSLITFLVLNACQAANSPQGALIKSSKSQSILYFNPEVFPDIEEIKEPTYAAFYSAVSEKLSHFRHFKMLRVDSHIPFDSVESASIREFCDNNDADFAVVPKVKYFKVGFGKYIFSNQVIVSMKLYDANGILISETHYDTYKKNARILGSAENSIKIGTEGAMNRLAKEFTKYKSKRIDLP